MPRTLYSLLVYLAVPAALVWFAYRGRRDSRYRRRWGERLGFARFPRADYWLHAASVGEVQAAVPVLRGLLAAVPGARILVTTTTPTGAERLDSVMGDAVMHRYLPLDLPGAARRFLDTVQPRAGIIMEVELWPNLLARTRDRGVPMVLANARLSARSAARYARLGRLAREALAGFMAVAAQSEADAERFRVLAPDAPVRNTGNVKFDMAAGADIEPLRQQLLAMVDGGQRPVWVAGSTREGEEALLLAAHRKLLERLPAAVLVLVPRHPERFDAVAAACAEAGLPAARRSAGQPLGEARSVLLGDSMGEMSAYYAAGRAAFVGGTLVPIGGHNVLEPAALERPVLVGPYTGNVAAAVDALESAGGLRRVTADAAALAEAVVAWLG
ncbi:3-deoxy-D-manno-octulosonic acid transferase, partial [Ectothiorhodospiraceae bacterium WFHF3C12]|nr:3-deoxy-D-manno-octulosonic acid transferase [Ectothiorhodospiraceae bacterium WFHF3C12]